MKRSAIVTHDEDFTLTFGNTRPWGEIPAERDYFHRITTGERRNAIIMGRYTWESISALVPLPRRVNIVVSRTMSEGPSGLRVVRSVADAFAWAEELGLYEAFAIGGEELFHDALPLVTRLYETTVHATYTGEGNRHAFSMPEAMRCVDPGVCRRATTRFPAWTPQVWIRP